MPSRISYWSLNSTSVTLTSAASSSLRCNIAVETGSALTRGHTAVDFWGVSGRPANANWLYRVEVHQGGHTDPGITEIEVTVDAGGGTVTLTVSGDCGSDAKTIRDYVTVGGPPTAGGPRLPPRRCRAGAG